MKHKNQIEQRLFELAGSSAANEESFPSTNSREAAPARKLAWDPYEVWRTRMKRDSRNVRKDSAPV